MKTVTRDTLTIVLNYSETEGALPDKSTMFTKLIESDDFNVVEGDVIHLNGIECMVQMVQPHTKHDDIRIIICVSETFTKEDEDNYNEIVEWFIDMGWHTEDSMYIYEAQDEN